ncbi:MAG TPA: N-acetylglucosamine/diacetylchitobiose ABC transporter substrate-binding protein [Actinophytocola sp.]|uniref:N-acetylglucosamine/diacetylchitobiose ABC transporter substrate-binding protein n=1 Tax=Actinophytocola sp. TaxID=1872138 RepID=UPI002DB87BF5|nr:N-acetylglucosamine/diacetylchitobiose ABC transporter substrate-binding protein [Actinophytocola sp.]HEU5474613.1 N-acetylglucosamine/diacetylchitobiose ABC transporter substrate-binding protein [Actinophytocola sp.]
MPTFSADRSRRDFLRTMLASGLIAVPGSAALAGCATAGGGSQEQVQGTETNQNPLGVDTSAPLEVVMFAGGLKTELEWVQRSYNELFPNAKINLTSTVNINSLQPRFTGGNPPDMVNNSGAQKIPLAALAGAGQLTDLASLLDAPSLEDPSKKVRDTIVPEAIKVGTYDDDVLVLNYVLSAYGVFYSRSLFEKNGWKLPTVWSEFISFAAEMKKAGLSPMGYGGVNAPHYVTEMMLTMAGKSGGADVVKAIDNLEPNAWKHDAVRNAAAAIEELARMDGFLPGSPGLKHTEAQTEFVTGKIGTYPSGSWLENEMKTSTPAGFDMVMAPTPRLDSSDKLPLEALHSNPGEPFIVPKQAKNARGGLEFFRHMLAPDNARAYSEFTGSLTIVTSSHDKVVSDSTSFKSVTEALKKAGDNTFTFLFMDWYGDLKKNAAIAAMTDLLTGRTNAEGFITAAQTAADAVAADSNVPKFKRK